MDYLTHDTFVLSGFEPIERYDQYLLYNQSLFDIGVI